MRIPPRSPSGESCRTRALGRTHRFQCFLIFPFSHRIIMCILPQSIHDDFSVLAPQFLSVTYGPEKIWLTWYSAQISQVQTGSTQGAELWAYISACGTCVTLLSASLLLQNSWLAHKFSLHGCLPMYTGSDKLILVSYRSVWNHKQVYA